MTIDVELPKHQVGTKFTWVRNRKTKHEAEVVGYSIEHHTDTGYTNVSYRISYDIGVQIMTATVARSTVDMATEKGE